MATLTELQGWRDALLQTRLSGTRVVEHDSRRVEYRSDAELAAALAAADRAITDMQAGPRVTAIIFNTSKGI